METVRWANELLSVVLLEEFSSPAFQSKYFDKINKKLGKLKKPSFLGEIGVSSIHWGTNVFQVVDGITFQKTDSTRVRFFFFSIFILDL